MAVAGVSNLALLQKWAPQFYFSAQELYLPCSVDWYLAQCSLVDDAGSTVYPVILADGRDTSCLADQSLGERKHWHVQINDVATRPGNLSTATCYGYARPVGDPANPDAYDLNYWMFYAFNGNIFATKAFADWLLEGGEVVSGLAWIADKLGIDVPVEIADGRTLEQVAAEINSLDGLGLHEGDWEYAVVRVTPDGSAIQQIYLSAHSGEGGWLTDFETNAAGQPIVYAARSSHANYATVGNHFRLFGLASDQTDAGTMWLARDHVVDVGFDPAAAGVLVWQQSVAAFGKGGNPSIAANDGKLVVAVFRNDDKLWYRAGKVASGGIDWWSSTAAQFDTGKHDPSVAIDDTGVVVSVHRSKGHNLYWNVGVADPATQSVTWWPQAGGNQYDTAPHDPKVAINNNGVVLSVHQGSNGDIYYNAGTIDGPAQTVHWASRMHGTSLGIAGSGPALAISDDNAVLLTYASGGHVYACAGSYDPASQTIGGLGTATAIGSGDSPAIAMSHSGQIVEVHRNSGKFYCNAGEVGRADDGSVAIGWQAGGQAQYATGDGDQDVALLRDGTVVEVDRNGSTLNCRIGQVLSGNFADWTPNSGQFWLKYSGHWGRKGSGTLCVPGGSKISHFDDGPIGPAYKSTYVLGP